MKRLVMIVVAAAAFAASSASASVPRFGLEDTCACGGTKLSLGGYPIGGGWWKCAYVINGWYVVIEHHYGGCP